jgi:hypothetical protein
MNSTHVPMHAHCTDLKGTGDALFISSSFLFSSVRYSRLTDESNRAVGLIKTQSEKD